MHDDDDVVDVVVGVVAITVAVTVQLLHMTGHIPRVNCPVSLS